MVEDEKNGLPQSPAQAAEGDGLAERLRIEAECDVLETARDDTFERLDAERWAAIMYEAADEIDRLRALSAEGSATIAAAQKQAAEDTARLDWLEANSNAEIFYEGWEDDVWQVHTVNGGRSDREWTLRGEGVTVRQAIDTAIETLRLRAEDQQKAAATPTIADPTEEGARHGS